MKASSQPLTLLLVGGLFLFSACSAYKMGTAGSPGFQTIFIESVQNETDAPQAVVPFTNALNEAFIADGRVLPAPFPEDADAILSVRLVRYERILGAADPRDTALGESFYTVLTGRATLTGKSDKVYFQDRPFRVESAVLVREDLVQADYQNIPVISRQLAEKIVRSVVNTW